MHTCNGLCVAEVLQQGAQEHRSFLGQWTGLRFGLELEFWCALKEKRGKKGKERGGKKARKSLNTGIEPTTF